MCACPLNAGAGTLAYRAPETFLGLYTKASEVYAFAVVLFELLTAQRPWHRDADGNPYWHSLMKPCKHCKKTWVGHDDMHILYGSWLPTLNLGRGLCDAPNYPYPSTPPRYERPPLQAFA